MVYSLLNSMDFGQGSLVRLNLIVSCINDWVKSLDRGFRTDIAIFDFSEAFDSVPHCRLFSKLNKYGMLIVLCKTGSTHFYLIGIKE